jgi:hypothetical protein
MVTATLQPFEALRQAGVPLEHLQAQLQKHLRALQACELEAVQGGVEQQELLQAIVETKDYLAKLNPPE